MTNFTAPVRQETIFPAGSRHRVICPNRVVKLRRNSVWLEQPFEGLDEIEFEVGGCDLAWHRRLMCGLWADDQGRA